ncbi:MAG: histidinol dehydrogenase, partial [Alphaproteobacteria bacterium]
MARRLDSSAPGFEGAFGDFLGLKRTAEEAAEAAAAEILAAVRARGDEALCDYTERFDGVRLEPSALRVPDQEIQAAAPPEREQAALALAASRIADYHRRQVPSGFDYVDSAGMRLGLVWRPLRSVGIYVPGGTAAYPSSVLMSAIPARVAGVERVVLATPAPGGVLNPLVLAAARLARVDAVYRIGGAQAMAALAYGTRSIAPVDKIFGAGGAYVAAAKRRLFGHVGVDLVAGPSEVLIVADRGSDPMWLASDLLAQAEHDPL